VARGDGTGTHIFSKTWEAHLAAIAHVRAVTRAESTTTAIAGPLPPPPMLRAAPDSAPPALRAEIVSAPGKGTHGKGESAVSGKTGATKSSRKSAVSGRTTASGSKTLKKTSGHSRKETLRPSGPPAPSETSTTKKRKKRAVKS